MSTTVAPPESTDRELPSGRDWRQRKARRSGAAQAVVVRGEPMLWLTGSALGLSLFMIIGLLVLIVVQGLRTFWPVPLVRFELVAGRAVMGEITRTETYHAGEEELGGLAATHADSLRARADGEGQIPIERYLVRTGNFDLTNTHFKWVSETEIAADGRTKPQWAVLLERTEWGRFYGEPHEFVIRHPRPISGDEEQLLAILEFFEKHAALVEAPPDLEAALEQARSKLAEARNKSTQALVEKVGRAPEGARYEAVLEDGPAVPLSKRTPDQQVNEIRQRQPGAEAAWALYQEYHAPVRDAFQQRRRLEKHDLGHIHRAMENVRLDVRQHELDYNVSLEERVQQAQSLREQLAAMKDQQERAAELVRQIERRFGPESVLASAAARIAQALKTDFAAQQAEPRRRLAELEAEFAKLPAAVQETIAEYFAVSDRTHEETAVILSQIDSLKEENERYLLGMKTAQGEEKEILLAEIVRGYPANQLDLEDKLRVYFSRWGEFVTDDPREANSEGGVWPAIWGTVVMTLFMSLAVVPFGVLAALYLREYAKAGPIVSAVRIAVNNLAGVPSIVFGVFGLGFFCYIIGAYIDGGPANADMVPWPRSTWLAALAGFAVLAAAGFVLGLFSLTHRKAEASRLQRWLGRGSIVVWLAATVLLVLLVAKTPFFDGFYEAKLPNPTFGKGALIWASLTLALMTLPVVIVATEEALAAVPNSMREGSYACGASKWQTIRRIVLPRALPGIMTGMILAMARGAGEVAPLMLVGAMKLAPELPVDATFPYVHLDRSFMHLGFHIYDLGFQSQNSEAAKPMVFTTTLLLISIIAFLNLSAVWLRGRLRQRFQSAQF